MRAKVLSAILTCANLLLVQGLGFEYPHRNGAANSSSRVLYGSPANVMDFPFLVAMLMNGRSCDGSIVASQWVLSAGHCLFAVPCGIVEIYPAVWPYGEKVRPTECYLHSQYSSDSHAYDISVMKVPINFLDGGLTRAVPLPVPGTHYQVGTLAVLAGWGLTEEGKYPDRLLWGEIRVEDWDVCNEKFMNSDAVCHEDPYCIPSGIPRRVLCTQGDESWPTGSCFGDSGGPVTINGVLAGIVSFGIAPHEKCAIGAPSMHVSVVDYLPWIYSFIDYEIDTSGWLVQPEYGDMTEW